MLHTTKIINIPLHYFYLYSRYSHFLHKNNNTHIIQLSRKNVQLLYINYLYQNPKITLISSTIEVYSRKALYKSESIDIPLEPMYWDNMPLMIFLSSVTYLIWHFDTLVVQLLRPLWTRILTNLCSPKEISNVPLLIKIYHSV